MKIINIAIWCGYGFMALCSLGMMEAAYCIWRDAARKRRADDASEEAAR
jgi:hypothetical protein